MAFTTADLLAAAKRGAGIQSNYRLARVLGTTDNTLSRWASGRVIPDDAYAVRMASLAGLDAGYVVAAMRAYREKDEALRAIWADMAERLLLTAGMPPRHDGGGTPPEGNDPESGGPTDDESASPGGLLSSSDGTHIMRSGTPADARLRRMAQTNLARRTKLKKSH